MEPIITLKNNRQQGHFVNWAFDMCDILHMIFSIKSPISRNCKLKMPRVERWLGHVRLIAGDRTWYYSKSITKART